MLDQKYINYIKMKLDSGSTKESIMTELINNSWTREQVDFVFEQFNEFQSQESRDMYRADLQNSSVVPPPRKSQLNEGGLNKVNAYVVPREGKGKLALFRNVFVSVVLLVFIFSGWYLFLDNGDTGRFFSNIIGFIEKYILVDIPFPKEG